MKKLKTLIAAAVLVIGGTFAFAQDNLVAHGTMEGGNENEWIAEGSSLTMKKGTGVGGSTGLYVRGKFNWSGVGKDLTKVMNFSEGTDYYVEVWFKSDPADKGVRHSDVALAVQPSGVSEEDYDSFIYMSLDDMDGKYTGSSVQLSNKDYVKVSGIISSESIKEELKGRRCVNATIYFKIDNPVRPYYIDNVVVKKVK